MENLSSRSSLLREAGGTLWATFERQKTERKPIFIKKEKINLIGNIATTNTFINN